MSGATPILETRDRAALEQALRTRLPSYLPGWEPEPGGAGSALLAIAAHYLGALAERVNQAPDRNKLAFLDMIGINLLTARAARAAVTFATPASVPDARAPAGTRLGAQVPGRSTPLVFETSRSIGIAAAPLTDVVTVWPGRDTYADHSADAVGGRPFTLWDGLRPVAHEVYIAHPTHLALAGPSTIDLRVDFDPGGDRPLPTAWDYWDGKAWRPFKDLLDHDEPGESFDGTAGLTRSGVLRLATPCAETKTRTVGGWESFWIRGRVTGPLSPEIARRLPAIDRIGLQTVLDRRLRTKGCTDGLQPENAFADVLKLDLTKPFQPLGVTPGPQSSFYFTLEETFSKPGAEVTICLSRGFTPQEKNDIELAKYEAGVNAARALVDQIRALLSNLEAVCEALVDPATGDLRADSTPLFDTRVGGAADPDTFLDDFWNDITGRMQTALDAAHTCTDPAQLIQAVSVFDLAALTAYDTDFEPISKAAFAVTATEALRWSTVAILVSSSIIVAGIADVMEELATPDATRLGELAALHTQIDALAGNKDTLLDSTASIGSRIGAALAIIGNLPALAGAYKDVVLNLGAWPTSIYLQNRPAFIQTARDRYADMRGRINRSRQAILGAIGTVKNLDNLLKDLTPITLAAAAGVVKPMLPLPTLVWEYWNGRIWRRLPNVSSTDDNGNPAFGPRHFRHGSGRITFTVPDDWEPRAVNDEEGLWLRVRIARGTFAIVKHVSWYDAKSESINFLPIIEPRPPLLDRFYVGYYWASNPAPPEHCLTLNDFQWEDRTEAARWRGGTFEPFTPVQDLTPTVYFGFDGDLPRDELGLWLGAGEAAADEDVPPVEWQAWDGRAWSSVSVDDETRGFARPGIAFVVWPGGERHETAAVVQAKGREIVLADARAASSFSVGARIYVRQGEDGELAEVESTTGARIRTVAPLGRSYARAGVSVAGLARFGTPRSWLRARVRGDGDPRRAHIERVYPNSTWAEQLETVADEPLGSSTGEPSQVHFVSRAPVLPGEQIEVRELEGRRAAVDYPLLVSELAVAGIDESDLRQTHDPVTGEITEVWVLWRERPNLFFSGPEDRHYMIERSRGRVVFGDGERGLVPPAGSGNLRVRRYRSGGGVDGNVPEGAISSVLSGVLLQGVRNITPAEGGADGEDTPSVIRRGPLTVRNRRQAVSLDDFEALAYEASPAVAVARALSGQPGRPPGPGWVTLVVVPHSGDPRPQPSVELRREVSEFVLARAPASLGGRLTVTGPQYLPVGVDASVAPIDAEAAGPVARAVEEFIVTFFHPVTGRGGLGWPFGRDVFGSDLAAALERLPGVDFLETFALLAEGVPVGDRVSVGPDRIVVAGPVRVRLAGGGR